MFLNISNWTTDQWLLYRKSACTVYQPANLNSDTRRRLRTLLLYLYFDRELPPLCVETCTRVESGGPFDISQVGFGKGALREVLVRQLSCTLAVWFILRKVGCA